MEHRTQHAHDMPFGAQLLAAGGVRFRLWAPGSEAVALAIEGGPEPLAMLPVSGGWHELSTDFAGAGARYQFVLPSGTRVPDPASRFQPHDVHGPSEVIDPREYVWQARGWHGRPWCEAVLYELHIGAFTPEGTFCAAIGKLDHLAALGITAIELMPIGDFPGARDWGYDGVLPYAPDATYGRPNDLKALVDAAHARGIMVFLDVVYNHFGPEGNYLSLYAPDFLTERHQTPWGAAVNFDGPTSSPVREFVIQNALYWLHEYRFDGLRLDAVHAILDDSAEHLLDELARRVRASSTGREVHLILENEHNEARRLARNPSGKPHTYTAQWNDDVHHVLHCAVTGERTGYYGDYIEDGAKLGRALAEGFAFQGELMQCTGRLRGEPCSHLPPDAFVAFIQNHDQVGNRAFGERLGMLVHEQALRAAAAVYLLLPQIPMLFMGEEWNASEPFPFFCDFSGSLGELVTKGRRREFAAFPEFGDETSRDRIPDPQDPGTFASAKLDWSACERRQHSACLDWYRSILAVRQREIVPRIAQIRHAGAWTSFGSGAVSVRWRCADDDLVLLANLTPHSVADVRTAGRSIWLEGEHPSHEALPPWSVRWSLEPHANPEA
jgi:malto-oligosyltrehalose trehalohydrolase